MPKARIATALLIASLTACPFVVGCDKPGDKVVNQSEKSTTDTNGNKSTTEQKTVQHSDGSTTTEKHTDTNTNK